jgi:hypothetical protein
VVFVFGGNEMKTVHDGEGDLDYGEGDDELWDDVYE